MTEIWMFAKKQVNLSVAVLDDAMKIVMNFCN